MGYLYGDSTPSAIDIDYIDFLGKAIDFCVDALLREHRIRGHEDAAGAARSEAEARRASLRRVASLVHDALEEVARAPGDEPATRCANTVDRLAADEVRVEIERLEAALSTRTNEIEELVQRERDGVVRALEPLVLEYDLPEASCQVRVQHDGNSGYVALLAAETPYGVELTLELDTSECAVLGKELRAGQLVDGIAIHAPQGPGLLRKRGRIVSRNVTRYVVTRAVVAGDRVSVELRASADGDAEGFDIDLDRASGSASLTAVSRDGAPEPFLTEPDDAETLTRLANALADIAGSLEPHRRALHTATFDDVALAACSRPSLLVERMLERIAPVVAEISAHSVTDGELVLRQPVDDGRREEIFVKTADLAAKLAPLPRSLRGFFSALGLGSGNTEPVGSEMIVDVAAPPPIPGGPDSDADDDDDGVPIEEAAGLEETSEPSIEIVRPPSSDFDHMDAVSGEIERRTTSERPSESSSDDMADHARRRLSTAPG